MVERVDQVLRSELGLADGLADPSVWVLDPCCGTGAYLVEVLDRIARTLREKGEDALTAEDLKQAAMTRVAGFEIMPAPYVIAHWQVGHKLRAADVPLGPEERAAVYLTNALTGWAAPQEGTAAGAVQRGIRFTYPLLADERDEAARVKQARPILVVLGNPPYNAFAGTSPAEESGLVEPYKEGLQEVWNIRKFNLDELYVRFFRIAERRIAEATGRGVVCFISNHSWLTYPSFVVMRQRLLTEFNRIWVDNLNGSKFETGKVAPDGTPDPSVFSTEANREGIQVGTAVTLLVKHDGAGHHVLHRDLWGEAKREALLSSIDVVEFDAAYTRTTPTAANRYSLRPATTMSDYGSWPKLPEIAGLKPFSGALEMRRGALLSLDRTELVNRMQQYFDPEVSIAELQVAGIGPVADMARFDAIDARRRLLRDEAFSDAALRRIVLLPFEIRWAYHTNVRTLWNEPRPELTARVFPGNGFVVTRVRSRRPEEGLPIFFTPLLSGYHLLDPNSHPLPILANPDKANLSIPARAWLTALGLPNPDTDRATATLPWHHALAIGYAPAWLAENGDGIRQDWPRVPLPDNADLLHASSALGARVAALLDPDTPVPGITSGAIQPAIQAIAVPAKRGGSAMTEADRTLTAGWGHAGKGGAVMPGRGRIVKRAYTSHEAPAKAEPSLLGANTLDVFLNADAFWQNVPELVWNLSIGGYQVIKKWLSYREQPLLGRALSPAEIRYVRDMARRLAGLLLMTPELDANYRACAATHRPLHAASNPERVDETSP